MKVKKLIELLNHLDQESEILYDDYEQSPGYEIRGIKYDKASKSYILITYEDNTP